MPLLHPRHREVARAHAHLAEGLLAIEEKYSLTQVEMLDILVEQLHRLTRQMLFEERHGPTLEEEKDVEA